MGKNYNGNWKKWKIISIVVVLFIISAITASAFICKHESVDYVITVEPTCTEKGEGRFICNDCDVVLEVYLPSAVGHEFGEYMVTTEPSPNTNGEESACCSRCDYIDKREFVCPHVVTTDVISVEPTCIETGKMDTVCERCHTVLAEHSVEAKGHNVEGYIITVMPTPDTNGVQEGSCIDCGETVAEEYVCPHEGTEDRTAKSATCQSNGSVNVVCKLCEKVLDTYSTNTVECSYSKWKITKEASPTENGEKVKTCEWCEDKITKSYSLDLGANYIYVKDSKLQKNMAISSFTQSAVDKYDIVYTTEAMDSNNPFILGHNYGTMQHISKLNKGDLIYVSVNGNVRTYKVVVSEFAMQNNSHTDIIGQSSGYSIWDNLGGETLHMYTCYGVNNGRWMVLAIRV